MDFSSLENYKCFFTGEWKGYDKELLNFFVQFWADDIFDKTEDFEKRYFNEYQFYKKKHKECAVKMEVMFLKNKIDIIRKFHTEESFRYENIVCVIQYVNQVIEKIERLAKNKKKQLEGL